MKKLIISIVAILILMNSSSWADNSISIRGVILESTCAIAPDNAYQTLDLGYIPIKEIERSGRSQNHTLDIRLINCRLKNHKGQENKFIDVTFWGLEGAQQLLQKKGVELVLEDKSGHRVISGITQHGIPFNEGDTTLSYNVFMIKKNKKIIAGDFNINLTMMLNYQ